MGALPKEERRFTYADYKEWELDEGERYEIINGEAFAMPGPNTRHQVIFRELFLQFGDFFRGKPCQVFGAPYDVRLFYEEDESDDTVVQPDIMVICDKDKIGPEGCRGAPDLIIEILSPSNTAMDMEKKFRAYRQAGVREYWIVYPEGPVKFQPGEFYPANSGLTVYCFKDGEITAKTYSNADAVQVSIFPELTIELEPVFA